MDPEEAEAWAAMRAAFADVDAEAGAAGEVDPEEADAWSAVQDAFGERPAKGSGRGKGAAKAAPAKAAPAKAAPAKAALARGRDAASAPASAPPHRAEAVDEDWLQGQVDRLVGEVQRLAGAPFQARLLRAVWKLPLEEQQEVLLGASGTSGELDEPQPARALRLWQLIQGEVEARLAPPPAGRQPRSPGGRSRSRSRSPSL